MSAAINFQENAYKITNQSFLKNTSAANIIQEQCRQRFPTFNHGRYIRIHWRALHGNPFYPGQENRLHLQDSMKRAARTVRHHHSLLVLHAGQFLRYARLIRALSHFREAAATPGHHHIFLDFLCCNNSEHFHEAGREKEKDLHLARQAPNQKFDSGHLSPPDKHFCERTAGVLRNFIIK